MPAESLSGDLPDYLRWHLFRVVKNTRAVRLPLEVIRSCTFRHTHKIGRRLRFGVTLPGDFFNVPFISSASPSRLGGPEPTRAFFVDANSAAPPPETRRTVRLTLEELRFAIFPFHCRLWLYSRTVAYPSPPFQSCLQLLMLPLPLLSVSRRLYEIACLVLSPRPSSCSWIWL